MFLSVFAMASERVVTISRMGRWAVPMSARERVVLSIVRPVVILNSQRVCILHAWDSPASVSVNYSTEEDYDTLHVRTSAANETALTGDGSFVAHGLRLAQLVWTSDVMVLSNSFSVAVESRSTLPARRALVLPQGRSAEVAPLLVIDAGPAPPRRPESEGVRARWAALVGAGALMVVALAVGFCVRRRRRVGAAPGAEYEVAMLADAELERSQSYEDVPRAVCLWPAQDADDVIVE